MVSNINGSVSTTENKITDSYKYRGISLSGKAHPITGDLVKVDDLENIKQSLRNIVLTDINERPFSSSEVGTSLKQRLFDLMDSGTSNEIQELLFTKIVRYESRVVVSNIEVKAYPQKHAIDITITFTVRGTTKSTNVSIFLERI